MSYTATLIYREVAILVPLYTEYIEYSEGTTIWRRMVRDNNFYIDKAITPTGFAGTEGIDWVPVYITP